MPSSLPITRMSRLSTKISRPIPVPKDSKLRQVAHAEADVAGAGVQVVAARVARPRVRKPHSKILQVANRPRLLSNKTHRQPQTRRNSPSKNPGSPGSPGNAAQDAGLRKTIEATPMHQDRAQTPASLQHNLLRLR